MSEINKETAIENVLHQMETIHEKDDVQFHVVSPDVLRKNKNPLYAGKYVVIERVATADESGTHNTQEVYVSEEIKNSTAQSIMAKLAKILLETPVDENTEAYKIAIEQSIFDNSDPKQTHLAVESMLEEIINQIELERKNNKQYETAKENSPKLIALNEAVSFLQKK